MLTLATPSPVLVREGFTEQDIWRRALGDAAPLRVFAMLGGALDAPDVSPAGALCSSAYGPQQATAWRA